MSELHGLYAITTGHPAPALTQTGSVAQAIVGGARIIQYRDKGSDQQQRLQDCLELKALCRAQDVLLIVNDDIELAAACAADGVHLGKDDADPASARERLGREVLIGLSCYDDWGHAVQAHALGADYIAFGSFFPSPTKPKAVRANTGLLRRARRELGLPVVAIGGITPENGLPLIQAGADMLAVVSGIFATPDIRAAARAYSNLFQAGEPNR